MLSSDSLSSVEVAPFPDPTSTFWEPIGEDLGGAFGGEETTWDEILPPVPPLGGEDLAGAMFPGGSTVMTTLMDWEDPWFDGSEPSPSEGDPIVWDPELPDPGSPPPVVLPPPGQPAPASIAIEGVDTGGEDAPTAGQIKELAVRFSVPLSNEALASSDFTLERTGRDGRVQTIFGPGRPPTLRLSGDGSVLLLIPDQPLEAGDYRLTLSGNARFVGLGGEIYDGDGTDVILSEFRVVAAAVEPPAQPKPSPVEPPVTPTGPRLSDATPLGTLGPNLVEVGGSLNLDADPTAVALYRFELGPDHFWRLGLEVSAGRLGSPLLSRLSLFDAEGRLLRTGTLGMADVPSDPFLFEGLEPGTYYVGLSGAGNDPSLGGYDPVTGALPVNLSAQRGGAYSLALVADVADAPTRVTGVELDRVDPADPVPTGLTIHFDGVVRVGASHQSDSTLPGGPIVLVDASGKVWKTGIVATNRAGSSLSVVFHDRLPRGRYEIRLAESGGLVDLVGRDPVAEGQGEGVLGRFEVTTEPTGRRPNDLGVLLPTRSLDPVEHSVSVVPGSSTTVRFVVAFEANYALTLDDPGGGLTVELIGPTGRVDLGSAPRAINGVHLQLKPGVYLVRLVNKTGQAIDGRVDLRYIWSILDSVPLNGVGQGPALGMRLAAPAAGLPQVGFDPPTSQLDLGMGEVTVSPLFQSPSNALAGGEGVFSPTAAMAGGGVGMPVGPMLTPEIAPIGFPTVEPLRIVAIDPDLGGALTATASLAEGTELGQMVPIGVGQGVSRDRLDPGSGGGSTVLPRSQADPSPGQRIATDPQASPEPEPLRPASSEAIDAALAMITSATPWVPKPLTATPGGDSGLERLASGLPTESEGDGEPERTEVSLIRALGIGLAVGWTARVISRRQQEKPPGQIRVMMSEAGVRVDDPDRLESVDELIERHPGSPASSRGATADRNR